MAVKSIVIQEGNLLQLAVGKTKSSAELVNQGLMNKKYLLDDIRLKVSYLIITVLSQII